jgi:hypothetical protein
MMFVRHNATTWHEPPDMAFEPSPVWHDDDLMVTDESAKIFLRNVLGKSKSQLGDLKREVDKKRRDIEGLKRTKHSVRDGKDKQDEVEVVSSILAAQAEMHQMDRKRLTAEVEVSTIKSAVGDVSLGAKNHNFKPQTFKIPTNCDLCGERIWGLSAKGFDCKDCGYTCHSKCEMKVPAECPGEQTKEEKKKLKGERQEAAAASRRPNGAMPEGVAELPDLSRSNTMNSLSSGYATSAHRSVSGPNPKSPAEETLPEMAASIPAVASKPTTLRKNRIVAPPPTSYISELAGSGENGMSSPKAAEKRGKMLYAYEASGEGEITVPDGRDITVLEPDGKVSDS